MLGVYSVLIEVCEQDISVTWGPLYICKAESHSFLLWYFNKKKSVCESRTQTKPHLSWKEQDKQTRKKKSKKSGKARERETEKTRWFLFLPRGTNYLATKKSKTVDAQL